MNFILGFYTRFFSFKRQRIQFSFKNHNNELPPKFGLGRREWLIFFTGIQVGVSSILTTIFFSEKV